VSVTSNPTAVITGTPEQLAEVRKAIEGAVAATWDRAIQLAEEMCAAYAPAGCACPEHRKPFADLLRKEKP
jgi:hypothetical protein